MLPSILLACALTLGQTDDDAPEGPPTAAAMQAKLATQVKALVQQLDSNQQAKREAAEKELIALGGDALPLLPAVSARTPAEVRNRLQRVRTALMQAAIESATKPATVTLVGNMRLSTALARLKEQTGNQFIDYRERFNQEPTDPSIDVSIEGKPFWEAFDAVLDAAGMTVYNYDEEAASLAYTARGPDAAKRVGTAAYSGLFRMQPVRIDASRNLRSMGGRTLKLTLDVAWEPRVRPIVLEQPLAEVKAEDENGAAIAVDGSEGNIEVPVEGSNAAVELEIPLLSPERSVNEIASLKGKLTAVLLGRVEAFEFDNLDKAKSVEQERGGVTVTLEHFRKNGEIFDAQIRVRFDKAANALESHRGWIYNNACYMLDPKGKKIENAGLEATLLDTNEVGLTYRFDVPDAATTTNYKFVYATPAAIIKTPVEFELKHVPLP